MDVGTVLDEDARDINVLVDGRVVERCLSALHAAGFCFSAQSTFLSCITVTTSRRPYELGLLWDCTYHSARVGQCACLEKHFRHVKVPVIRSLCALHMIIIVRFMP